MVDVFDVVHNLQRRVDSTRRHAALQSPFVNVVTTPAPPSLLPSVHYIVLPVPLRATARPASPSNVRQEGEYD